MIRALLLAATLCLFAAPSVAQPATATVASQAVSEAPVAVPAPTAEAVRYHRTSNILWAIAQLWGLLVPAALLFTGFSAKIRDVAGRATRNRDLMVAVYGVLFVLITWGVGLPLDYYREFAVPHQFGLSSQSFSKWQGDQLRQLAMAIPTVAGTIWIVYALLRRSPRRWWLYTSLVFVPILAFVSLIQPVLVDPLFNRFGPLQDAVLERELLTMAHRVGIEDGRVFEVDKSVDTNTMNAYVTGLGGTQRIVLWDTLLERLERREVLFVMGHEMGHYVLGHTLLALLLSCALVLAGLFTVHRTAAWVIRRFHRRIGFDEISDLASVPLLLLVLNLVLLVALPVVNAATRHAEHEADRFVLELTRDNQGAARAFVKLQASSLSVPYPGPFYRLMRASHPSLGERIEFANRYRPWETGEPLRYADHMSPAHSP